MHVPLLFKDTLIFVIPCIFNGAKIRIDNCARKQMGKKLMLHCNFVDFGQSG